MIKSAPSTPNAGSSFVSSTIGVSAGEILAVGVIVAVYVTVALKTTGTTVVMGIFLFPDWLAAVVATELVVRTVVRATDIDGEIAFPDD